MHGCAARRGQGHIYALWGESRREYCMPSCALCILRVYALVNTLTEKRPAVAAGCAAVYEERMDREGRLLIGFCSFSFVRLSDRTL